LDLEELAYGRVWVGDEATRVRRVALHPRLATTSTLLSAQCSAVQVWDIANSDTPILAKRVSCPALFSFILLICLFFIYELILELYGNIYYF
jgi:hypothetical protein